MTRQQFDFVVIGGGIFGCYAALYLADKGASVALLEKEARLFQKASLVNQARLHSGYHYPRSVATAALSDEHKERFTAEHKQFVHFEFEKFYAIDRFGSFTDAGQFERFCDFLHLYCEPVKDHPLFNYNRLEALYRTKEYSFDPVLLGVWYSKRVMQHPGIALFTQARLTQAHASGREWVMTIEEAIVAGAVQQRIELSTPVAINATYAASNAVNHLFGVRDIQLTHEISEIAFISSPQFHNKGLTVMDGPFGSIMPYGQSGLLSLSSVAYTHHKISYDNLPVFDCQDMPEARCRPEAPAICTDCVNRPESNAGKMLAQMSQYFDEKVQFNHLFSYYTIKSKLKSSYIDDGRPTEISVLSENPHLYCLFAGKINSIYEVEKIVR